MDCKFTSPGLMFFNLRFVFEVAWPLPPVQQFFKCFGSRDREARSTKVSGGRLVAHAFRLGSSWNSTSHRTAEKRTNCLVLIANSPADARLRPSGLGLSTSSSGSRRRQSCYH